MDNREILENLEDALANLNSASDYLKEISKEDDILPILEDIADTLERRVSDLHKFVEAIEQAEQDALEREYWGSVIRP